MLDRGPDAQPDRREELVRWRVVGVTSQNLGWGKRRGGVEGAAQHAKPPLQRGRQDSRWRKAVVHAVEDGACNVEFVEGYVATSVAMHSVAWTSASRQKGVSRRGCAGVDAEIG